MANDSKNASVFDASSIDEIFSEVVKGLGKQSQIALPDSARIDVVDVELKLSNLSVSKSSGLKLLWSSTQVNNTLQITLSTRVRFESP